MMYLPQTPISEKFKQSQGENHKHHHTHNYLKTHFFFLLNIHRRPPGNTDLPDGGVV